MGRLQPLDALKGHEERVWNASWHPEGTSLATCGEDKAIYVWSGKLDGTGWSLKTKLTDGHTRTIREVSWSPCGNFIASASFDGTVGIWERSGGSWECSATLEGHENEVKSVSWAQSGQLLATCSRDKSVWVWEVNEGTELECAAVLNAHQQDVKKVRWHPETEVLASASYDNTIKMFREDPADNDWTCFASLTSHDSTVWSIAFDGTGTRLASVSDDKTLKIWREYAVGNSHGIATPNDEPVWKLTGTVSGVHTRTIYDVTWCGKSGAIATACGDDCIRVFEEPSTSDPHAPNLLLAASAERAHSQDVNSVQWCPTQVGLLASCGDDGLVKLWRYSST